MGHGSGCKKRSARKKKHKEGIISSNPVPDSLTSSIYVLNPTSNFPLVKVEDNFKIFPKYSSILKRSPSSSIAMQDLDKLQWELETMLSNVVQRFRFLAKDPYSIDSILNDGNPLFLFVPKTTASLKLSQFTKEFQDSTSALKSTLPINKSVSTVNPSVKGSKLSLNSTTKGNDLDANKYLYSYSNDLDINSYGLENLNYVEPVEPVEPVTACSKPLVESRPIKIQSTPKHTPILNSLFEESAKPVPPMVIAKEKVVTAKPVKIKAINIADPKPLKNLTKNVKSKPKTLKRSSDLNLDKVNNRFTKIKKTADNGLQKYWSSFNHLCRDFVDNDIEFLREVIQAQEEPNTFRYLPVGKLFAHCWAETELAEEENASSVVSVKRKKPKPFPTSSSVLGLMAKAKKDILDQPTIPPTNQRLYQRLLTSFKKSSMSNMKDYSMQRTTSVIQGNLETRIRLQLTQLGLLNPKKNVESKNQSDDLSEEIKRVEAELKVANIKNRVELVNLIKLADKEKHRREMMKMLTNVNEKIHKVYRCIQFNKKGNIDISKKIGDQAWKLLGEREVLVKKLGLPRENFSQIDETSNQN